MVLFSDVQKCHIPVLRGMCALFTVVLFFRQKWNLNAHKQDGWIIVVYSWIHWNPQLLQLLMLLLSGPLPLSLGILLRDQWLILLFYSFHFNSLLTLLASYLSSLEPSCFLLHVQVNFYGIPDGFQNPVLRIFLNLFIPALQQAPCLQAVSVTKMTVPHCPCFLFYTW